ncbi:IS66 family transposase [Bradyrhizobium sp. SZCCHNRI2013]|uniref:IS66 family transposase n=1 Tax=Bradyrhizobium sp. SZCCHNRI2013 TaxID=3057284 RepID=UPI002916A50D|nr:transposase [Bradyrhizobium sp. SZCCHNRI2013]
MASRLHTFFLLLKGCALGVRKFDALVAIKREVNGLPAHERKAARNARSRPLIDELYDVLRKHRTKLSGKSETAEAIDYSLKR